MFKKDLYSLTNRELEEKYKINNFMQIKLIIIKLCYKF